MKIRTITTGISLDSSKETAKIKMAANFNKKAQMIFAEQGYEVQTTRITTNTTVPIPGDITTEKIAAILSDMATLAFKLNKPLSARLFPIPDKKAGEMTSFNSPYLVDCQIFSFD